VGLGGWGWVGGVGWVGLGGWVDGFHGWVGGGEGDLGFWRRVKRFGEWGGRAVESMVMDE